MKNKILPGEEERLPERRLADEILNWSNAIDFLATKSLCLCFISPSLSHTRTPTHTHTHTLGGNIFHSRTHTDLEVVSFMPTLK